MSVRDEKCILETLKSPWPDHYDCFEWGSGGSTVLFSKYAKSWVAMEHDEEWAEAVWEIGGNVVLAMDPVSYCDPFEKLGKKDFDFIFVDGQLREACMMMAVGRLRKDGLLFVHDARRAAYAPGAKRFGWNMRVGDDLLVCAHKEPVKKLMKLLRKFELRGMNTGSYPWHPDHFNEIPEHLHEHIPFCGYASNRSR